MKSEPKVHQESDLYLVRVVARMFSACIVCVFSAYTVRIVIQEKFRQNWTKIFHCITRTHTHTHTTHEIQIRQFTFHLKYDIMTEKDHSYMKLFSLRRKGEI